MKRALLSTALLLCAATAGVQAQDEGRVSPQERYIEVSGSSQIEVDPDEVHFIITIREYWQEEFDGVSKPEDYRTKVPLSTIESDLRGRLAKLGISSEDISTQEIGDWWRQQGQDFLISKQLDIKMSDFDKIDDIIKGIDTRGVQTMRIGELRHKDMADYRRQCKIEALKAARDKAAYMAGALGQHIGSVLRIVEYNDGTADSSLRYKTSNVVMETAATGGGTEQFRKLVLRCQVQVRFLLTD